ncbi:secretion protein HlyD [Limnoglobus roseus]|uniref:Secretion protein HlyD n=2 Tax=Limnoglobus roseus TaxID=2598579 RepID=A0A5C1AQ01_9BACT|nr:secretion protein HlyD [Limnoglobus roseus]
MTETTARNGELVSRVQQLRLNNQLGADRGGGGGATWLPWVLCLVLALAWAGVGIRSYRNAEANPQTAAASGQPAATSAGSTPPPAAVVPGTIQLEVKGYLVPAQQIAVSPIEVAGRLIVLNVVEGKSFKQGEVLAQIEAVNYQAQLTESQSALLSAQGRLEASKQKLAGLLPGSVRKVEITQVEEELKEADAQLSRMMDEVGRLERLGASAADKESKQARFDMLANEAKVRRLTATLSILKEGPREEQKAAARADVQAALAEVEVAKARLAQAQWRLDNCTIRSPIDGTVLTKKAELGNLVNPLAFAASSGSVCDIANLADLEVDLEIPERDISKLKAGQRCRLKADAYTDRTYEGRLDRIMPIANRAKSIVNVRVKVALPPGEIPGTFLKPEMGAVVSFLAEEGKKPEGT